MEESTTILLLNEDIGSELNIRQPLYTDTAHNKLVETENKLNQVFEEYTGRIESLMLMLDTLKDGVLIINQAGDTCYSNEAGNDFLKNAKEPASGQFSYRPISSEQIIPLKNDASEDTVTRVNNFFWNGEQCNIFIIEKREALKPAPKVETSTSPAVPLETLINQVRLIAEYDANGKITEAAQCAEFANKTITESEKLLSDIKSFMGLVNYQPALLQISMQKIVGDVLKFMGPEIEEAEIEVSVSELPETTADKELISKLLKQLISNALKFRNKGRKAIIDIGHDKSDGQFIFCVRDNGIGISKKHHEEVFNLFVSLNDQKEYPGNGLGLAICKKIVDLHEGKIWVESLPGHGSNFYFKLNAKQ